MTLCVVEVFFLVLFQVPGDVPGSCTCGLKDAGVAGAVSLSEGLHHAIDLLSLTRETETPQKLPVDSFQGFYYLKSRKRY